MENKPLQIRHLKILYDALENSKKKNYRKIITDCLSTIICGGVLSTKQIETLESLFATYTEIGREANYKWPHYTQRQLNTRIKPSASKFLEELGLPSEIKSKKRRKTLLLTNTTSSAAVTSLSVNKNNDLTFSSLKLNSTVFTKNVGDMSDTSGSLVGDMSDTSGRHVCDSIAAVVENTPSEINDLAMLKKRKEEKRKEAKALALLGLDSWLHALQEAKASSTADAVCEVAVATETSSYSAAHSVVFGLSAIEVEEINARHEVIYLESLEEPLQEEKIATEISAKHELTDREKRELADWMAANEQKLRDNEIQLEGNPRKLHKPERQIKVSFWDEPNHNTRKWHAEVEIDNEKVRVDFTSMERCETKLAQVEWQKDNIMPRFNAVHQQVREQYGRKYTPSVVSPIWESDDRFNKHTPRYNAFAMIDLLDKDDQFDLPEYMVIFIDEKVYKIDLKENKNRTNAAQPILRGTKKIGKVKC